MVVWHVFVLKKIVQDLFKNSTAPPTSAACERSFSTYGNIHMAKRNRLTTARAGKLVLISQNMKLSSVVNAAEPASSAAEEEVEPRSKFPPSKSATKMEESEDQQLKQEYESTLSTEDKVTDSESDYSDSSEADADAAELSSTDDENHEIQSDFCSRLGRI